MYLVQLNAKKYDWFEFMRFEFNMYNFEVTGEIGYTNVGRIK